MSTTESPFSLTFKVGRNNDLLTGRADTVAEMAQRVTELRQLEAVVIASEGGVAAPLQVVTQVAPPAVIATVPDVQQAVNNFNDAGITGQIVQGTATSIEQKEDKFGGKYTRGNPDAGDCSHGPRIYKDWRSKAGKQMQAYVCTNDSPFGNWKDTKCDLAWAN